MPTKLKGMTSLEIAIIVAIVLVIAVAVGWYLYTTFIAAATGQPTLNIVSAEMHTNGTLRLILVNPGPVDVRISSVEIAGRVVSAEQTIRVGQQVTVRVTVSGLTVTPGTKLPGRVILSGGQSFPFNAVVKP